MPRTKGSRNKKIVKVRALTNFKSMEVKVVKTQVVTLGLSKADIENLIKVKARNLSKFSDFQLFEKEEIVYDKKGNAFITLINPIKEKEKLDEKSADTSSQK